MFLPLAVITFPMANWHINRYWVKTQGTLVAMPGAPSSFLLLVAMPFVPSSFLFLVVRPGAPSSILGFPHFKPLALVLIGLAGPCRRTQMQRQLQHPPRIPSRRRRSLVLIASMAADLRWSFPLLWHTLLGEVLRSQSEHEARITANINEHQQTSETADGICGDSF